MAAMKKHPSGVFPPVPPPVPPSRLSQGPPAPLRTSNSMMSGAAQPPAPRYGMDALPTIPATPRAPMEGFPALPPSRNPLEGMMPALPAPPASRVVPPPIQTVAPPPGFIEPPPGLSPRRNVTLNNELSVTTFTVDFDKLDNQSVSSFTSTATSKSQNNKCRCERCKQERRASQHHHHHHKRKSRRHKRRSIASSVASVFMPFSSCIST